MTNEEIIQTDIYLRLSDHNVKIYIENCEGTKQLEIRNNEIIYKYNIFDEIAKLINSYENATIYYDKWHSCLILENIKPQCPDAEFKELSYNELQNIMKGEYIMKKIKNEDRLEALKSAMYLVVYVEIDEGRISNEIEHISFQDLLETYMKNNDLSIEEAIDILDIPVDAEEVVCEDFIMNKEGYIKMPMIITRIR